MIAVFTGNGKGKTTAALGQAMRALGDGKRVLMVQFIKGPWESGEDIFLKEFQISKFKFQITKTGRGFVGILGDKLPIEEHRKAAEEGLALAQKEIESGNWDIVILDEINNAVALGLVAKECVLELLKTKSYNLQAIILTGRDAPREFIDLADLVTEMQDAKHPFEHGIKAKRGLEY